MKTARFASVVEKSGAPETYLLWMPPKQDNHFQRALAEHRIMTIHSQNVGSRKDSATVGFIEEPNAQYLIFPRSLKRFSDRKIVGINYDLLARSTRSSVAKTKVVSPSVRPTAEKPVAKPVPKAVKNVVPFSAVKPALAPMQKDKSENSSAPKPAIEPAVLRELKKALAELRAGKDVPAYERLDALVKANDS